MYNSGGWKGSQERIGLNINKLHKHNIAFLLYI